MTLQTLHCTSRCHTLLFKLICHLLRPHFCLQIHNCTTPSPHAHVSLCWALAKFWLSPGRWALVLGAPKGGDRRRPQVPGSQCWPGSGLLCAGPQEVQEGPDGWGCQPRSGKAVSGLLELPQPVACKVGPRDRDVERCRHALGAGSPACLEKVSVGNG